MFGRITDGLYKCVSFEHHFWRGKAHEKLNWLNFQIRFMVAGGNNFTSRHEITVAHLIANKKNKGFSQNICRKRISLLPTVLHSGEEKKNSQQ